MSGGIRIERYGCSPVYIPAEYFIDHPIKPSGRGAVPVYVENELTGDRLRFGICDDCIVEYIGVFRLCALIHIEDRDILVCPFLV